MNAWGVSRGSGFGLAAFVAIFLFAAGAAGLWAVTPW